MTTAQAFRTIFFMGMSLWTAGGMHIELATPAHAKKLEALRTPAATPSLILADIDSQVNSNTWRDADPVTWAHETCHGIASRIRGIEKQGRNGFYCLAGNYISLAEPAFTLARLADIIPQEYRGVIYDLYLIQQQRYWNLQPSYILDEGWAYLNGTLVGLELELSEAYTPTFRGARDPTLAAYPAPFPYGGSYNRIEASYVRSLEAATYSLFLMHACPAYDLRMAVGVLMARNVAIFEAIEGSPFCTAGVEEAYQKFAKAANG